MFHTGRAQRLVNVMPAVLLACGVATVTGGAGLAQQRIGEAAVVANQVARVSAGRSIALGRGGAVFRDERIRTGQNSAAKLVFLDNTNLAVGPSSNVLLDRFVYSGASRAVSVNLARGAFRFTTGVLDKRAYKINTAVATIGVRGTVLGVWTNSRMSRVTLVEGAALVCLRGGNPRRPRCIELTGGGQGLRVTRNSIQRVATRNVFSFEPICRSYRGVCEFSRYAGGVLPRSQPVRPGRGWFSFGKGPVGQNPNGIRPLQ